RAERIRALAKESQAGAAIRMTWNQIEVDAGHAPEKTKPDEESHVPAQQDELHDGNADEDVPHAGRSERPASTGRGIPGGLADRDATIPKRQAENVDTGDERELHGDGVPQSQR